MVHDRERERSEKQNPKVIRPIPLKSPRAPRFSPAKAPQALCPAIHPPHLFRRHVTIGNRVVSDTDFTSLLYGHKLYIKTFDSAESNKDIFDLGFRRDRISSLADFQYTTNLPILLHKAPINSDRSDSIISSDSPDSFYFFIHLPPNYSPYLRYYIRNVFGFPTHTWCPAGFGDSEEWLLWW